MHAISCASPSHVALGDNDRYDVVCWTVSDGGKPTPWIIYAGEVCSLRDFERQKPRLCNGTVGQFNRSRR